MTILRLKFSFKKYFALFLFTCSPAFEARSFSEGVDGVPKEDSWLVLPVLIFRFRLLGKSNEFESLSNLLFERLHPSQ
jgi:hypothetical protein